MCEKYKISGMLLISLIDIWKKHFDFMNKCSINEYDVFSSINHNKMSNSKIIIRIKNVTAQFPSEHQYSMLTVDSVF